MSIVLTLREAAAAASIREKISVWIEANALTSKGAFDANKMKALAVFVARSCGGELQVCMQTFADWVIHPEQPNLLVYGTPGKGDLDPDVYVIGWRPCDSKECLRGLIAEGTTIHDHGDSRVVVTVVQGSVVEENYVQRNDEVVASARLLQVGETIEVGAPAIHRVHDGPSGDMALTVHVYYPPLEKQKSYIVRDGHLVVNGG